MDVLFVRTVDLVNVDDFEYLGTRDGLTIPEFIKRTNKNYKIITKMFKEN